MKTLVLHIGMAKTGTSTIQKSLAHASHVLQARGITCASWVPVNHSFDFTVLFLEHPKKSFFYKQLSPITDEDWASQLQQLREQWIALFESMGDDGTCIISAENLTHLPAKAIQRLQVFTAPYFDQLRAIVYVRDPLKSLRSQWEQDVKEIQAPIEAQALLSQTKQRMGYRFLERWSALLGDQDLVVRKFDPAVFFNGNLLDDFFHALGIDAAGDEAVTEVESNQSLGSEGVSFLLALNNRYPQYLDGAYNPQRGLSRRLHLFYSVMRKASREPLRLEIKFDEAEAAKFNRKVAFLNEFLGEEAGYAAVEASGEQTRLPDPSDISADYYVELINGLALLVDEFAERSDRLTAEKNRLEKLLANQDENDS